jgi:hypothetical protein
MPLRVLRISTTSAACATPEVKLVRLAATARPWLRKRWVGCRSGRTCRPRRPSAAACMRRRVCRIESIPQWAHVRRASHATSIRGHDTYPSTFAPTPSIGQAPKVLFTPGLCIQECVSLPSRSAHGLMGEQGADAESLDRVGHIVPRRGRCNWGHRCQYRVLQFCCR